MTGAYFELKSNTIYMYDGYMLRYFATDVVYILSAIYNLHTYNATGMSASVLNAAMYIHVIYEFMWKIHFEEWIFL